MSSFLITIIAFVIAISILVAVHEFGHFSVARLFGIKVLKFSIGFGRPLLRWHDKYGTEYLLSAIPLGGYVSLFGERGQEVPVAERSMAFSHKSVWIRMAVLVAGPLFNFLLAIFVYWLTFLIGFSVLIPTLGTVPPESIAGLAGLQARQEIVMIDEKPTPSWEAVSVQLLSHLGEDKPFTITLRDNNNPHLITKSLNLGHWDDSTHSTDILEGLGFRPFDPVPAVIEKVLPGFPAEKSGLLVKDKIMEINGHPIQSRSDAQQMIQTHANETIHLKVMRNDHSFNLDLKPVLKQLEAGKEVGVIGVEFQGMKVPPQNFLRTERFGPITAFLKAVHKTWQYSILTLEVFKKMLTGQLSVHHVSGPIAIAKYAGETIQYGLTYFLSFLGGISIGLGVLNLLPIPLLDGGHLLYCVWEVVSGKRVSRTVEAIGLVIGGVILIAFMTLALFNDISLL